MNYKTPFYYRFRGFILGTLALALIITPGARFAFLEEKLFVILPYSENSMAISSAPIVAWLAASAILFSAGVALRIGARRYIGEHSRGNMHDANELVTEGPYALIRHPLYTSNLYIAISFISFHLGPTPLSLPFLFAVTLFEAKLSRAEDRFLQGKFGDAWKNWASTTPAFLPKLKIADKRHDAAPLSSASPVKNAKRTYLQAFCADWSTWAWLAFFNLVLVLLKVH